MPQPRPSGRRQPAGRPAVSPGLSASFAPVRAAARHLAEIEHTTMYGAPALKLHGRFLACMAVNKAAEPNTLVVAVGFDQREALIAAEPATYYLKDHYQPYPAVLVRLSRIPSDALESLLREAWHFVHAQPKGSRKAVTRGRPGKRAARPARR